MSAAHLGQTIDIHAGGVDLVFPHHENEVAQSTCAHGGRIFARFWLHNGLLNMEGRKMSKSLGNVLVLHELLKMHPPEALRLLLLRGHYRQPLDWSPATIAQAIRTLDGWYGVLRDLADIDPTDSAIPTAVEAALCDDINTPQALAEIAHLADTARKAPIGERPAAKGALLAAGAALGLFGQDPEAWFKRGISEDVDASMVEDLLQRRREARAARDWVGADAIRDELSAMGVTIEDGPQGTRWSLAK